MKYRLKLLGAFRLTAPDGKRVLVSSKKGIALLGLLATAKRGERWRAWLQEKLWGSRESPQAQASLRRELHGLRNMGAEGGLPLIEANHRTVRLMLENIESDVRDHRLLLKASPEFLEGINIAGEEGFAEWLWRTRKALQCSPHIDNPGPLSTLPRIIERHAGLIDQHTAFVDESLSAATHIDLLI